MDIKENVKKIAVEFLKTIIESSSNEENINDEEENINPEYYIKKYELDKPENMVKFIVEIYFDSFESVIEGIEDIRIEMLGEVVSYIDTAKKNLLYAYENPDYKEEKLGESHSDLTNVTSKLESKIKQYACELEKINNRNGLSSFIFSPFDLTKVKNIMKMSKIAFTSYFEAIFLLTIIDNSRKANSNIFIEQGTKFIYELENQKYIDLFLDYDKDKNELWNIKYMQGLIEKASLISESFDGYLKELDNK